jgi:heat shock protein HslJ
MGALLGAVALATTGCGGSGPTADDLDDTSYLSQGVTGRDLVAGSTIRLTFEDGRLSVNADCNTMGGPFEVDDGTLRWTSEVASTAMGCVGDLADQDEWLTDLFTDGVEAELDGGTLTLISGDVTIDLTAA